MSQSSLVFNATQWLSGIFRPLVLTIFFTGSVHAQNIPDCVSELDSASNSLKISTCIQKMATWIDEIENVSNVSKPNLILTGYHITDTQKWSTAEDNKARRLYREFVRFPEGAFAGKTPVVTIGLTGFEVQGNIDLHVKAVEVASSGFFLEIFGDDGMKYGHFEVQWTATTGNVRQVSTQRSKFID